MMTRLTGLQMARVQINFNTNRHGKSRGGNQIQNGFHQHPNANQKQQLQNPNENEKSTYRSESAQFVGNGSQRWKKDGENAMDMLLLLPMFDFLLFDGSRRCKRASPTAPEFLVSVIRTTTTTITIAAPAQYLLTCENIHRVYRW